MNRREFLKAAAAASMLALPGASRAGEPTRRPNIIFFIADDMHADMFNWRPEGKGKSRGKGLAPAMDRLAAEATIMWGQHIISPVCTPSRYNSLSGRYASRAQVAGFQNMTGRAGMTVITWNTQLLAGEITVASCLQKAGYATGIVGKTHQVMVPGFQKVAKTADPREPKTIEQLKKNAQAKRNALRAVGFDYAEALYMGNCEENGPAPLCVHNMEWVAKAGLDFIDQNRDKPFFLYFSPTLTHSPYARAEAWGADPLATPDGFLEKAPDVLPPRETLEPRLKAAGIDPAPRRVLALWMDDALGALIKKLEAHKLMENTIILFFNDNGQDGKGSIYQSGAHAPSFIWRKEPFACGHDCQTRVTNLDFAPTLIELGGGTVPEGAFDGVSFKPVLDGKTDKLHDAIYFELGFTRGVLKENWKYIALRYPPNARDLFKVKTLPPHLKGVKMPADNPPFGHIGGNNNESNAVKTQPAYFDRDQLYDLAADPKEQQNLATDPRHGARLAEMKGELKKFLDKLPGGFAELK